MARIVNIHHLGKSALFKGNAECVDPEDVVMAFFTIPSYVEVVERMRMDLNWMETNDVESINKLLTYMIRLTIAEPERAI
jgi:hypothetical protein